MSVYRVFLREFQGNLPWGDLLESRFGGYGLVHSTLSAATALLPDGAGAGGGEGIRVPGQLEPVSWGVGGGCGGGGGGATLTQQYITRWCRQLQGVLNKQSKRLDFLKNNFIE